MTRALVWGRLLLVGVLHRGRPATEPLGFRRLDDGAEGDAETFQDAGELGHGQNATFRTAVIMMLARAIGISTFHANLWS